MLTGPDGTTGFDPTGLAKGWAVEGASAYLEVVDRISFCINAGGDLVVGVGRNLAGYTSTWRVGIQDPRDPMATVDVVKVSRGAVATSGGSARGAHVIDPRNGSERRPAPVRSPWSDPDLVWADVWATAAWVDPDEATRLMAAQPPGIPTDPAPLTVRLSGVEGSGAGSSGRRMRSRCSARPVTTATALAIAPAATSPIATTTAGR